MFQDENGRKESVPQFGHGDHYINIKIKAPKNLTAEQAALLKAYAEIEKDTPGTVMGLTYALGGKKVVIEDKDGLVADIREVLEPEPEKQIEDSKSE